MELGPGAGADPEPERDVLSSPLRLRWAASPARDAPPRARTAKCSSMYSTPGGRLTVGRIRVNRIP